MASKCTLTVFLQKEPTLRTPWPWASGSEPRGSLLPGAQVTWWKSSAAVAPGTNPTQRAARPLEEQQSGSDWEKGSERHRWGGASGRSGGGSHRAGGRGLAAAARDRGAKAAGRTMARVQGCQGCQNRAEEPASGGHGGRRGSRRGHGTVCTGRVWRGAMGTAATPSGSDRTARRWGSSGVAGSGGPAECGVWEGAVGAAKSQSQGRRTRTCHYI